MSLGELILTLIVALVVFGPKQLKTLARHAAHVIKQMARYKEQMQFLWESQMHEQLLQENRKKAREIDEAYQMDTMSSSQKTPVHQDMN